MPLSSVSHHPLMSTPQGLRTDAHPLRSHGRVRMTSRPRIIALQAAVVGVLLVVVYFTILRPNDNGDVSGVNAPGAPPTEVATQPTQPTHHRTKPRQPQNRPRHAGPSRPVRVAGQPDRVRRPRLRAWRPPPGTDAGGGPAPNGGSGDESPTRRPVRGHARKAARGAALTCVRPAGSRLHSRRVNRVSGP